LARQGRESKGTQRFATGRFDLVGAPEPRPQLRVELVDPKGKRSQVELSQQGEIRLDAGQLGQGIKLEVRAAQGEGDPRVFSYDALYRHFEADPVYRVPQRVWEAWIFPLTCVTGHVTRCWPILLDPEPASLLQLRARLTGVDNVYRSTSVLPQAELIQPFPPPWWCGPVCQGKVEVYLRICCCPPFPPPPVVIRNICEIIDCHQIVWPPDWPPHGPGPGPGPDPGPVIEQVALQAIEIARNKPGAPSAERILDLVRHLVTLHTLAPAQQVEYIKSSPELVAFCCFCSTRKVAEVPIQDDGHFDACFFSGLPIFNCSHRVLYRVWQIQGGAWVLIYDGLASNQSFDLTEDANLQASWNAQVCGDPPPPVVGGPLPFVLLESIGGTWMNVLNNSTTETSETTWNPPAAQDGTVYSDIRPWATTLSARYHFSDGLAAVGAQYYRTRTVSLAGGATPQTVMTSLSWLRYQTIPAGFEVVSETLGPLTVGPVSGLYRIPYHKPVDDWLGGQFHAFITTATMAPDGTITKLLPDGQHLFVVDIFDGAGNRLIPAGAPAAVAGEIGNVQFDYRRMEHVASTPIPTDVVAQKALPNLFLINNNPCQGAITGLDQGGVKNQNCLSLSKTDGDTFEIAYYAFQPQHYMNWRSLTIKKGLFGAPTTFDSGATEVPGPPGSDSASLNISALLGADKHCSFTVTLVVDPKHWDGWGYVWSYRIIYPAAFALTQL
jgi:hypothetical protein